MCELLENYFQVSLDLLWMNIGKQIWDGWNKMLWCWNKFYQVLLIWCGYLLVFGMLPLKKLQGVFDH